MHRRLLAAGALVLVLPACGHASHPALPATDVPVAATAITASAPPDPPPASEAPSSAPSGTVTQEAISRAVATAVPAGIHLELAIADLQSGLVSHVGSAIPVRAASLTKLLIFLARARGGALAGPDLRTAQDMIERSDNDAATQLWRTAGRTSALMGQVSATTGMTQTTSVSPLLLPWDGWVTTASDQLALLRRIRTSSDPAATQLRELLGNVEADQSWGAGRVPGSSSALVKNGWLPVNGRWVVNTDGCFTSAAGRPVCVAAASSGSSSMAAGISSVQAAVNAATKTLDWP